MEKFLRGVVISMLVVIPAYVYAQTAKIVNIKGDVVTRNSATAEWKKAQLDMELDRQAELQTKGQARCTLVFDEENKNILTLKENSYIKIFNVTPGNVFLPDGRILVVTNKAARNQQFQVCTPTTVAAAKAKATGWMTDYHTGRTQIACFVDTVAVSGIDAKGNGTGYREVDGGYGIEVKEGGLMGQRGMVNDADKKEWLEFIQEVESFGVISGSPEKPAAAAAPVSSTVSAAPSADNGGAGLKTQDASLDEKNTVRSLDEVRQEHSENLLDSGVGTEVPGSSVSGTSADSSSTNSHSTAGGSH